MGNVFSYILKKKDFNADYVGKYKDQKAYSYFDSGFIGPITFYKQTDHITFIYCEVTASQRIHEKKKLWIVFENCTNLCIKKDVSISAAWCSCMAGASGCCNHIISALYKIEYANSQGWCTPACTEQACQWNKTSKKDVVPQKITELIIRKKLGSSCTKSQTKAPESKRMILLSEFDPRIQSHQTFKEENFIHFLNDINGNAVVFKSIEEKTSTTNINHESLNLENLCCNILQDNNGKTEAELTKILIENLTVSKETVNYVEYHTRDQSKCSLWFQMRKGRCTASIHHEIYTKVNSLARSTGKIKPKTTPLVSRILYPQRSNLNTPAVHGGPNLAISSHYVIISHRIIKNGSNENTNPRQNAMKTLMHLSSLMFIKIIYFLGFCLCFSQKIYYILFISI